MADQNGGTQQVKLQSSSIKELRRTHWRRTIAYLFGNAVKSCRQALSNQLICGVFVLKKPAVQLVVLHRWSSLVNDAASGYITP